MGALSPWHLAILAVVVIALFGAKRLPDTARGIGQSLKILKSELSGDNGAKAADAPSSALPQGGPATSAPSGEQASTASPATPPTRH